MRPIANFTLHALFAAAIAALATSSAAAQHAAGNFYLQLDGNDEGMVGSAEGDAKANWIEIDSWQWAGAVAEATGRREKIGVIPFEYDVKSPRDVASGQASGKRQHAPVTVTRKVDLPDLALPRPLPQGSVRVRPKMPWLACRVGARYPVLVLGGDGQRYRLLDAAVSSCGPDESVTFVYAKLG